MIDYGSIPPELASHNTWINWYPKPNPQKSKPDKVPTENNFLNRTHPLNTCLRKISDNPNYGLGFVFNPEQNGIVGIDFDNVVFNGDMTAEAMGYVNKADTFAEFSDSGKGIHCYGYSTLAENLKNRYTLNRGSVEVYSRDRFFAFTGEQVSFTPARVEDLNLQLVLPFLKEKWGTGTGKGYYEISDYYAVDKSIRANLVDRLARDTNKATFLRLFNGRWTENKKKYPTQSEADLGLITCVMFYAKSEYFLKSNFGNLTEYDIKKLAFSVCHEVVKQSKLNRKKWDRADYRFNTLQLAFDSVYDTYNPKKYHSDMQRINQSFSAPKKALNNKHKIEDAIAELETQGDKVSFVNISKLSGLSRQHVSKIYKIIG